MDKFEYKIKADEIKELIARQEYEQAAEIADSIDWRRVKSVMMLCTVSDLYKMCRRYEDSRDMLLLAYERHPGGRTILYSLCELSIKMEEFVQAVEYYKEYVQIAPKDTGRYILQYKLYEAQDVSLEERIAVLEDMKKREYREKWAYELAYLYHRVGLATKCVEECDELVLWFGAGKYVSKALELKMLHAPLTPEQQYKYDQRFEGAENGAANGGQTSGTGFVDSSDSVKGLAEAENAAAPAIDAAVEEMDIQVKTYDVGQYDTINLQEELAAGIQEYFGSVKEDSITRSIVAPMMNTDTIDLSATAKKVNTAISDPEQAQESLQEAEVFFEETGEIHQAQQGILPLQELTVGEAADLAAWNDRMQEEAPEASSKEQERGMLYTQPPREMAGVLSMDADGQISFVLPQRDPVEKQITGQISINDIILEWERLKKENAERRKEEIRQRVLQQTGTMFSEFDAAVRDGLLEQLEQGREVPATAAGASEEEMVIADFSEDLGEVEELTEITEVTEVTEEMEPSAEEEVSEDVFAEEEVTEEPTEQITEEPEAEPTEEIAEEPAEEVAEAPAEEITEEPAEEVAEEAAEAPTEEIAEEPAEEVAEEAAEAPTEETAEEPAEEIAEAPTEETAEEPAEEVAEEPTEEITEEPAVEVTEETAEEPAEEITEEPAEEVTEEPTEDTAEEAAEEQPQAQGSKEESADKVEKHKIRNLTREERELYGQYIQGRSSKEQLIKAIDNISMAAYTGNVIVTGDDGMDPMGLAKNIVREVQMTDSNFSGKIAKISGDSLNERDVKQIVDDLVNGALIIQKAALMKTETADSLYRALQPENKGIVVVLVDTKKHINRLLEQNEKLLQCFTARVDIAALSNDALVLFAKKYAREKEYSIDELGLLALHTRIADMQTSEHSVTILDVKEIMDEAIESANRKTIGHFFDIVFARRYDDDDMIILREKDFI